MKVQASNRHSEIPVYLVKQDYVNAKYVKTIG